MRVPNFTYIRFEKLSSPKIIPYDIYEDKFVEEVIYVEILIFYKLIP